MDVVLSAPSAESEGGGKDSEATSEERGQGTKKGLDEDASRADRDDDVEKPKVLLQNLGYNDKKTLEKALTNVGIQFVRCKKVPGQTTGVVTFDSEAARADAMPLLENLVIKGRTITASFAKPRAFNWNERRPGDDGGGSGGGGDDGCGGGPGGDDRGGKRQRVDGPRDAVLMPAPTVQQRVTPWAHLPYAIQLQRKQTEMRIECCFKMYRRLRDEWGRRQQIHRKNLRFEPGTAARDLTPPSWLDDTPRGVVPFRLDPIRPSPQQGGYRNKCEFTIGFDNAAGDGGNVAVGFRLGALLGSAAASVARPAACANVPADMVGICAAVEAVIAGSPLAVYDVVKHTGVWRTMTLRQGRRTGQAMLHLVVALHTDEARRVFEEVEVPRLVQRLTGDDGGTDWAASGAALTAEAEAALEAAAAARAVTAAEAAAAAAAAGAAAAGATAAAAAAAGTAAKVERALENIAGPSAMQVADDSDATTMTAVLSGSPEALAAAENGGGKAAAAAASETAAAATTARAGADAANDGAINGADPPPPRPRTRVACICVQEYMGRSVPDPNSPVRVLWGEDHIEEELLGLRFRISPGSFFQVNTEAAEVLYNTVVEHASAGGPLSNMTVLDVCCGTGTIGLVCAKRGAASVTGVEMCEPAVEDARKNAAANGITSVQFVCGRAEAHMQRIIGEQRVAVQRAAASATRTAAGGGASSSGAGASANGTAPSADPRGRRAAWTGTGGAAGGDDAGGMVNGIGAAAVKTLDRGDGGSSVAAVIEASNGSPAADVAPEAAGESSGIAAGELQGKANAARAGESSNGSSGVDGSDTGGGGGDSSGSGGNDLLAIVDPPREGLHADCLAAIRNCATIKRLVYVSCNPTKSLVKDVKLLGSAASKRYRGKPFRPVRATPVDMFPHTPHCEMVMTFERD